MSEDEVKKIETQPNQIRLTDVCGRYDDLIFVGQKPVTVADIDHTIHSVTDKILVYKAIISDGAVLFDYTLFDDNKGLTDSENRQLKQQLNSLFQTSDCSLKACEHISPLSSGKFRLVEGK